MTMQERLRELGGDMGPEAADYIDELEAYADKLAAGLPDGMLPKDVELLGQTNLDLIQQRDELEARVKHLHKVVGIERDAANDALGRLEQIEGLAKRRDEK